MPGMQGWFKFWKEINIILQFNRLERKNCMIILRDAEKAYDKIQHALLIETFSKLGIEGSSSNWWMEFMKKQQLTDLFITANIIFNGQRMNTFSLKSGSGKDVCFHCSYPTLYWRFYPEQWDKKKKYKAFILERKKEIMSLQVTWSST